MKVRGFLAGEDLEIQLVANGSQRGLIAAVASASGSATLTITIPTRTTPGDYTLRAAGYVSSVASTSFRVT